ncbi:MAG: Hsp20 family protein [Rhodobacteraceae bacterium]|nr:Hsp20 family protein [Paracoccaceae bacterium]
MTKLTLPPFLHQPGVTPLAQPPANPAPNGSEGYPPFDIVRSAEGRYRITLAVAGFRRSDVSITLDQHRLVVRGRQTSRKADRVFLHRGIAARQFQRSFLLAEGIEVSNAVMDAGLLHIHLMQARPHLAVEQIQIKPEKQQ